MSSLLPLAGMREKVNKSTKKLILQKFINLTNKSTISNETLNCGGLL